MIRRGLIVFLVAFVLAIGPARPASADDDDAGGASGRDSAAIAINTKDGSDIFRFAFSVVRVTGEVADPKNYAVAFASCTECNTVAIAIQVVLIEGSPDVFTPENIAIAINVECSHCETLATAYQYVYQGSTPMRLTRDGRQQLHEVLQALRDLKRESLTAAEMQARVEEQAHRIRDIFATQLVPVGAVGDQGDGSDDGDQPSATTTTSTSGLSTTSAPRTTTTASTSTSTTSAPTTTTASTTTTSTTTTTSAP